MKHLFKKGDENIAKRPEIRKKISEAKKGQISWTKGKHLSKEHKKSLSISVKKRKERLGYVNSPETRQKMSEAKKGKPLLWRRGENNPLWRGGITPINKKIRNSIESRLWREAVYARDNFTCQKCNIKGGKLHPHHIQNFAQYPDLRFAIDNGITFCENCHIEFHKRYGRKNNTKEQIEEFLHDPELLDEIISEPPEEDRARCFDENN